MRNILIALLLLLIGVWCWQEWAASALANVASVKQTATSPINTDEEPREVAVNSADLTRQAYPDSVVDATGSLGFFGGILKRMTQQWSEDLGIEVQVIAVPSEVKINQLATEIFELRQIGKQAENGGVLILLNPTLGEARIQLSYELEPVFTDFYVNRLAQDQLVPYASYSSSGMAVMDVLHHMKDYAYYKAARGEFELNEVFRNRGEAIARIKYYSGGGGARMELPELPSDAEIKAPVPEERKATYAPSADPLESAEAFLRSLRDFVGDPNLELYTPGSRVMNRSYPFAPFEKMERLYTFEDSKPFRTIIRGDRAVVTSDHRAHGFTPILLHRIDGTWRVDLVEVWKNLRFTTNGDYVQHNTNNPYSFGLGQFSAYGEIDIAALDLGGNDLETVIAAAKAKDDALSKFLLAEVYFRNCWATFEAMDLYLQAARQAPKSPLFWETLGDRAHDLGFLDLAAYAYKNLHAAAGSKLVAVYWDQGEYESAAEAARLALQLDPYDLEVLRIFRNALEKLGEHEELEHVDRLISQLNGDPLHKASPVVLSFDPPYPVFHNESSIMDGKVEVFDHSYFAVTMTNTSSRPVEIVNIIMRSKGTQRASGLGDIKNSWRYSNGQYRLEPGEALTLERLWGFTVNVKDVMMSNEFEFCWRGVGEEAKQCKFQRVDTFPL